MRRIAPPSTSATSFSSRFAIASPKRSTSASRSRRWHTTTYYSTVPRLLSSCSRSIELTRRLAVRQPGDRIRARAVARHLGEPAQLGARGDALPLVREQPGADEDQLGDVARRRLTARPGGEQHADDAAVRGVERRSDPVGGPERRERARRRAAPPRRSRWPARPRASGITVPRGTRVAARVDHPALALVPVDLAEHEAAARACALQQVEDLRRGVGKAAESPRGEAGQGVEELCGHASPLSIGQMGVLPKGREENC